MKIKDVFIEDTAALAPMAGVSDKAFRLICKEMGAAYLVTEMVSAKALCFQDKKSRKLMDLDGGQHPVAIQLFGYEPDVMAEGARLAMEHGPDVIDINMGCPAPKITSNFSGSRLMTKPELAEEIVKAVVAAVQIPVTVKFRKGFEAGEDIAADFARRMEAAGASALTIHGKTRAQMYAPPVDRDCIRSVKEAVQIPVIANGEVDSVESYQQMLDETGCDLVMVGRGALGNPFLFRQIKEYREYGRTLTHPTLEEKVEVMLRHIRLLCDIKGEYIGMKEARKHATWYFKGVRGAAALRGQTSFLSKFDDLLRLSEALLKAEGK